MSIQLLYDWFRDYSQSFYSLDQKVTEGIRHKEDHSIRVAANSLALAQHLGLCRQEMQLAEAIGLLHDVARYTQWSRFKSFSDPSTQYDHGTEGAAILACNVVLHELFSKSELDTLLFAIKHHNKACVPDSIPNKLLMAKIIRDADKLDIFRTLSPVTAEHDYSPALISLLKQQRPLPYSEAKKPADRRLLRLGWLYDINFNWTLQQLVNEGYAHELLSSLPDNGTFNEIRAAFGRYLSDSVNF